MIFLLFSVFLWPQQYCNNTQSVHPQYKNFQKKVDDLVASSANLVTIATEADKVLSQLLRAKSPVIVSWLNKRNLMSAKEEVIAGEWRKYYLQNFILSKFPSKDPKINTSINSLFSKINETAFPQSTKNKINDLFTKAQGQSVAVVKSWKLRKEVEKEILHRIQAMELYWFEKLSGTRYEHKPLEYLKWGLAYDPLHNQINVGIDVLKYPNAETIFSVLAHEIGHSIDACRWSSFFKTKNPFNDLYKCLREQTGAKIRDDSRLQESIDKKILNQAMAKSLQEHPFCNRSFYPPIGTQKEQILEVFADWFSAEALAISPFNNSKLRSDLCEESTLKAGSSYIPNQERLEKIYWTHPKIKEVLKTKSKTTYCPFRVQK